MGTVNLITIEHKGKDITDSLVEEVIKKEDLKQFPFWKKIFNAIFDDRPLTHPDYCNYTKGMSLDMVNLEDFTQISVQADSGEDIAKLYSRLSDYCVNNNITCTKSF